MAGQQHGLWPVFGAERGWRHGARSAWQRGTEGALVAAHGQWPVQRHHVFVRAAGRFGPWRHRHACRARRRHVEAVRPQDLDYLGRTRYGGEHRPSRAGACRGQPCRNQGLVPVLGTALPRRQEQRRALRVGGTQAWHQGQPDLRHGFRRQRRCAWLVGRQPESGHQQHVHHDERDAPRCRLAGRRPHGTCLPACFGLRQGTCAGP